MKMMYIRYIEEGNKIANTKNSLCKNQLYILFPEENREYRMQDFYFQNMDLNMQRCIRSNELDMEDMRWSWGSRSNVMNCRCYRVRNGLFYEFETYDHPPYAYVQKLSEIYGDLHFYMKTYHVKKRAYFCNMGFERGNCYPMIG